MPMVSMAPLIKAHCRIGGFAYGAFNVNSVAQIEAAIQVHEQFRAPAILQGADLANGFMGGRTDFLNSSLDDKRKGAKNIGDAVRKYAQKATVPVVLHLDHGKSLDSCKAAIDGGYTSVMIDGSDLPFEENVALTREIVKYAHPLGVTVEGELGVLAGVEDAVSSEHSSYTNPLKAIEFFRQTEVDALAISYGTKHGAFKGENVKLRGEIVIAIQECMRREGLERMLVSHGSSVVPRYITEKINALGGAVKNTYGIPLDELQRVITQGIGKINVDTDIRLAVTRNLREYFRQYPNDLNDPDISMVAQLLNQQPEQFDPRLFFAPVMDAVMYGACKTAAMERMMEFVQSAVREVVGTLVVAFGAYGKAEEISYGK